jgi:hypothetical protein
MVCWWNELKQFQELLILRKYSFLAALRNVVEGELSGVFYCFIGFPEVSNVEVFGFIESSFVEKLIW